ncbi:uncharacterized protein LOC128997442 [Macrosteles quadrilineatus]|uniref:uncharacterized protein LOC128997442 n=1 Tax=Macrosteles quadrilineatus TaxID=74068 RepID=UPI0023E1D058|nr:uncharacterized protein LOC128997442 [Macrosteles quadrilineatus]
MESTSVLGLCIVLIVLWKYRLVGVTYYIKWLLVFFVLLWRRIRFVDTPEVVIFPTKKEEFLERPRTWTKENTFRRDSMLVFAASQDVWLLMEVARGRYNSAAARVRLHFRSSNLTYHSADQDGRPGACEDWVTDTLAFQCLEPMRRWRIVFTGKLQCKMNNIDQGSRFVKINLIWAALNGPYYYDRSGNISALARILAEQPLSQLQGNLESLGKGYEQWGVVQGTVSVEDIDTNLHTPSLRRHCWKWPHVRSNLSVVGLADNGALFSINYNFARCRTQLGHIRYADGRVETIVGDSSIKNPAIPDKFVRTFKSSCFEHQAYIVRRRFQSWGALQVAEARCTFDYHQATCLILSWARTTREDLPELPFLRFSAVESSELLLTLDHPACANPSLVGGKAASLGLLTDMAQSVLRNKMMVPAGFCLTVNAMQLQVESSLPLSSAVKFLNLVSNVQEQGNLQEQCQHVVAAWLSLAMCPVVVAALSAQVVPTRSYAVRSSATGEDCEDSSAAGQNATVLGCVGVDAVIAAVHKCWASLYTYQSVQYRRCSVNCREGRYDRRRILLLRATASAIQSVSLTPWETGRISVPALHELATLRA